MSRLIDADALMKEFAEFVKESNNSDFADVPTWNDAVSLLGSAPTVMAIPIEWIKKKSLEFLMNRNFRWATDFQEVIDMWKVENNIPLFDDELKITVEKENQSLE